MSRRSLTHQVTDALRDMIITGALAPGERLTHDDLATQLGVSTMPVRESLLRLSYEGFIEASPNRSFRVGQMTRDDLHDVYWMHGILAGELTARACEQATPELVAQLRDLMSQWNASEGLLASADLEELNSRFHSLINRAAESPRLIAMLLDTVRFIPEHFYAMLPEWSISSVRSHNEMVDAIGRGDAAAGRQAAEDHVREAGEMLTGYFNDRGYWSQPSAADVPVG
jgi:DNA-binding GntR family transcriptional regulator